LLSLRGPPEAMLDARNLRVPNQTFILLDETTRALLGLEIGGKCQFEIVPAHWWGRIW